MSVINQMLKDLEKRSHVPMDSQLILPVIPAAVCDFDESSAKKYRVISVVFFLVAFLFILSYKFIFMHSHPLKKAANQSHPFIQPRIHLPGMTMQAKNVPLHLTPSILTAITLQLDKETTALRLLLSQNVLYQVTMHQHNKLILLLENARLVASLPPINTANSALENIQMMNSHDGNLKIMLTLKDGVEVAHLELNEKGKLPELQLDLLSTNTLGAEQTHAMAKNSFVAEQNGSIIKLRTDLSLSDQYQQALQLATQGHHDAAIKMLTALLVKDPDYAAVRESLASLLISQGNTMRAQQIIKIGLQQRPFYPAYVQLKARMLVDAGKINQALYLLQLAPPTLTSNPDYHAFIAALYQRQGQPLFAEKLYEQLLALQPNNATWWIGLGIALESMGKQTLAMEAYLKAGNSGRLNPELKVYAETRINHLQS